MEKNIKLLCSLFAFFITVVACKKEAPLTAEEQLDRKQYTLPQGDHPFDQRIVDFYDKYGTYILYKFNELDFRWNFRSNILFEAVPAAPEDVEVGLNFLDKNLFGYYDGNLLKKLLPFKVMLCKKIIPLDPYTEEPLEGEEDVVQSESHIAFGQVNQSWKGFSDARKMQIKGQLQGALWSKAIDAKKIEIAPDFIKGISYLFVGEWNYRDLGLFKSANNTMSSDVNEYVSRITSHTKAELEKLYFNPEFDPTGIYRRKYEAFVTYYKSVYNIDLQAIGEAGLK